MRDSGPGIPDDILPHVFEPSLPPSQWARARAWLTGVCRGSNHAEQVANHPDGGLEIEIVLPLLDKLSSEQMHEVPPDHGFANGLPHFSDR